MEKKIFFYTIISLAILSSLVWAYEAGKEFRSDQKDILSLPNVNLLLKDSSGTISIDQLSTDKPILLMYFSPDCEHCQGQVRSLLKNIDAFKNVRIFLITPMPLNDLKIFYSNFHLGDYNNIIVAKDQEFKLYNLFNVTAFPYTAIYNSQKKLIKLYKREISIDKIIRTIRG